MRILILFILAMANLLAAQADPFQTSNTQGEIRRVTEAQYHRVRDVINSSRTNVINKAEKVIGYYENLYDALPYNTIAVRDSLGNIQGYYKQDFLFKNRLQVYDLKWKKMGVYICNQYGHWQFIED